MKKINSSLSIFSLLLVCISTVVSMYSCSENTIVKQFICGTTSQSLDITGTVVSTSEGYYIMPADPIKNIDSEDLILLEAIIGKKTSDNDTQEIIDLSALSDCRVSIKGLINPTMPYKFTKLTISDKSTKSVIYHVTSATVTNLTSSRSGMEHVTCGTSVSAENYESTLSLVSGRSSRTGSISSPCINLFVHVLRQTSGAGYDKEVVCATIKQNLIKHYKNGNITFNIVGSEYNDIIDNNLYNYATSEDNIQKIFNTNRHSEAIDIYVYSMSNNGYLAGRAENIPSTACIIFNEYYKDNTVAHELGHCLGLYHTHFGTSGESSDEVIGIPELVDGSNSAIAGDFITDTPADPNEWSIDGKYNGYTTDANGQKYKPDPKNIMCYSGVTEYFTAKQFEFIKTQIGNSDKLQNVLSRKLPENSHYKYSDNIKIDNISNADNAFWTIKHYTSKNSTPTIETSNSQSYKITSNKSELLEISVKLTYPSGLNTTLTSSATIGAPSPYLGTLAWSTSLNGQSGGTNSDNYGSTLSISENTTLKFEYLDPVSATLPGINFMCVTSANRMLRGTSMTFTKADCSSGMLKIRAIDNCGTSDEFFTIMVNVIGNYYAINITDDTVVFSGKNDSARTFKTNSKEDNLLIKRLNIYDEHNNLMFTEELEHQSISFSIPRTKLSPGNYIANITDGVYAQDIPFSL